MCNFLLNDRYLIEILQLCNNEIAVDFHSIITDIKSLMSQTKYWRQLINNNLIKDDNEVNNVFDNIY